MTQINADNFSVDLWDLREFFFTDKILVKSEIIAIL